MPEPCPCGSGRPYPECCQPHIEGAARPRTAEELMRSRYTAYATHAIAYLSHSWHPDTRPSDLTPDRDLKWIGLKILSTEAGGPDDETGWVAFVARYKIGGRAHRLRERSRFVRHEGRWVYLDGEIEERHR
ncbi:YchJ family protein [Imhoffiella purpurea]|uniref:UPF0225 protein D779_2394 n=1 Tax=Imhoffiella purpurea TaxID=1249627 RepID=W9VB10_9GAMM|nr:YchJ family metal-binding protein [Imhoffiella purpurea]EXJ16783.1 UPF0225 protein YchJ [Imhoffiella purpurea]